jgi:rare lipoprotein A
VAAAAAAFLVAASAPPPERASVRSGEASWYGPGFHGKETASGERYDQEELTAAHPTLPFGTRVRVTLVETGRSVVVRINDRGPTTDRIIDLSRAAARELGLIEPGTGEVRIEILERGSP